MTLADRLRTLVRLVVQPASAHCDTEDGPVVTAGRRALAANDVNPALPWVREEAEADVRAAFDAALAAPEPRRADAEHAFLGTLVRLHREGEGAGFDGIKPAGTPQPPAVTAADEAIATGTFEPLEALIEMTARGRVAQLFARALSLRDHDPVDVEAGRAYVAAYVRFVHTALHHAAGVAPAAEPGREPEHAH